jgi:serine protease Do
MRVYVVALVLSALALCVAAPAGAGDEPASPPSFSTIKLEGAARGKRKGVVSSGSAVHLGNGVALTAAHVPEAIRGPISAKLDNGGESKVVVLWVSKPYDVALVRLEKFDRLPASQLSCKDPEIGAPLESVGNPYDLEFIHTWGHVAGNVDKIGYWERVYPASLTVAPGMSGGPVFNAGGKIAGLNVGTYQLPISLIVAPSTICMLLGRGVEE